MTQNNQPPQYGFGNPNSLLNETAGMQTTDWSYTQTFAALSTVVATLVPAVAIPAGGQIWEIGFGVGTNGAASSTLTATFVLSWTQQTKVGVATITPTLSSPWQSSSFVQITPDINTTITLTWTATVQNGTASAFASATATRVL